MKNIVVCCDGTGNEYGRNNTNVVATYALARAGAGQVRYYDPGVGTGGWEYDESSGALRAANDRATGVGLQKNVEDAYRFLMGAFAEGDRVFLFGFSRGAFTVRSLAGMLFKCGLLEPAGENLVEYASKLYNTEGNDEVASGFRRTFARRCPVHFVGVWDTVESLALNAGKRWHDSRLNPEVRFGCHALAIDERRRDFSPCLWDESAAGPAQSIEQVWFAGAHSDVGGWYDERGLSNLALQWMLARARLRGMEIDADALAAPEHRGDPLGELHDSFTGLWKLRGSRRRRIPEGARIHRSVLERRDAPDANYLPRLPESYEIVA